MTIRTKQLLFEACVETLEDALIAEDKGASRIELCSALDQDGLTPSRELTAQCLYYLSIPVMAMVRPRGGNFVYSEAEVKQMESDIEFFKEAGVAGVVFGLLTKENTIDIKNTQRLVKQAFPLDVTFHKAIDYTSDILQSFQELNAIDGISRVLTSGGMDTALNGREIIWQMQHLPQLRIKIIAAGKLLPENRDKIARFTGVTELHGKQIV
jgi:copper homeostasis protein